MWKGSNQQNCGYTVEWCYESVGLNTEQTKIFLQTQTASRNWCAPQALFLWLHNQRWQVRAAGEVCDSEESEREAKVWKTGRHTASHNGWLNASSRDHAGWRRLMWYATRAAGHHSWWDREEQHSFIFMASLIQLISHVINCHSNAFASSVKSWIT